jgi:serine/threonine-protein kinase
MTQFNLIGQTLRDFKIDTEVGRGAMGVVYRAQQLTLKRMVALKVLAPELTHDPSYVSRFRQEAQSAATLEHPHIIPIYEIGEASGLHYIAMRYISGQTLRDTIRTEGAMPITRVLELLWPVAQAMDYAHQRTIIHRDIKPSNIMVSDDGTVYLADFGLARGLGTSTGLTMAGTVMGTPEYMSPEQAEGRPNIGPATDIYALAIVAYQMLTGNLPFTADTPMGLLAMRISQDPRPLRMYRGDLPPGVESVIMQGLAREPQQRYASAGALLNALGQAANIARPASGAYGSSAAGSGSMPPAFDATQVIHGNTPPYGSTPSAFDATQAMPGSTPPAGSPLAPGGLPLPDSLVSPGSMPPQAQTGQTSTPKKKSNCLGFGIALAVIVVLLLLMGSGVIALALLNSDTANQEVQQFLDEGAAALARENGMDDAIAAYEEVLSLDEDNVEAHTQLALIYLFREQGEQAEEAARAAIESEPESALAHALLAEALNNQEDYDAALTAANQAISLDDELSSGYAARAAVRTSLASLSLDENALEQAADDAERAIELASAESNLMKAMAHNARGVIHWETYVLSQDASRQRTAINEGVEQMLQAIGLQSQIALFQSNLGFFYNAQGDRALVEGREEEAEELFDQALQRFESAIDADRSYAHAYNGIGNIHYSWGDYGSALESYEQVLDIDQQNAAAYMNIGLVYRVMDPPDYAEAIDAFEQAAGISPENPVIYYQIAETYQFYRGYDEEYGTDAFLENLDQAETYYRQALDLNEDYVYALSGLGWVFYNRENFAEAESQFRESLDVKEDQAGAYNGLGWSLYYQEKYEDAPGYFERAIELLPDYPDAYLGLAWTLETLGDVDGARLAYEQVLKLASEGDWRIAEAEEGLQRLDGEEGGPSISQTEDEPTPLELPFDDNNVYEPSESGEGDFIGPDNSALNLPAINQGTLSPGTPMSASLDTVLEAHDWTFEGQAGQVVTLRCTAAPGAETDPRINLLAPDGSWLSADDDGGEGLSSLIANFELPMDGIYTVKVDVFEIGEYVLVLESSAISQPQQEHSMAALLPQLTEQVSFSEQGFSYQE